MTADFDTTHPVDREYPMPNISGYCQACFGSSWARTDVWLINTKTGMAHDPSPDGSGCTDCGHVATGPNWWWRS